MADVEEGRQTRQTIRRMAEDDEPEMGPYFPSGMSAPEAAVAGAIIPEQEDVDVEGDEE